MKNKLKIIKEITDICLAQFMEHKDDECDTIYIDPKTKTLSWIFDEGETTNNPRAIIEMWVRQSLRDHRKVLLYTCRDNREISLTFPLADELEETLEYCELQELESTTDPIFYIGFD